ncbi:MAG: sensor histidine kinase [Myxococcota bacterium]
MTNEVGERSALSGARWFDLAVLVGVGALLLLVCGLLAIGIWRGMSPTQVSGLSYAEHAALARSVQAERAVLGLMVMGGLVGAAGLLGIWWLAPRRSGWSRGGPFQQAQMVATVEGQLLRDLSEHGLLEIPIGTGKGRLNTATRRLLGLREVGERSLAEALSQVRMADRVVFDEAVAKAASPAGPNRVSVRVRVPDGQTGLDRSLSVTGRVTQGEPPMLVALLQDVTARVEQSRQQRARTAWLEARMASRTAEVELRAAQARQLSAELGRVEGVARARLARQLHDGLQQTLAAARMRLALLSDEKGIRKELDDLLAVAIGDSRNLAAELDPPVNPDAELGESLIWLQHRFRVMHELDVVLDNTMGDGDLPSQHGVTLFRAAQELLFNVVKHSGVNKALLSVRHEGEYITLRVRDEGCGISGDATARGFGLGHLDLRLQALGGGIELSSAVGGVGCTATAWLPLG